MHPLIDFEDLGKISYADALAIQRREHERILARRDTTAADPRAAPRAGTIFLLEHNPPVVTVTRRPGAAQHVLASPERLAGLGVQLVETDRGGDVTWHGPGQIVVYLILDLNVLGLRIHSYLRLLEQAVIDALARVGITGARDESATGVWVGPGKICAMGVRLSRWVSMHGIALNVAPDLSSFDLIVPCGLAGRQVTSIARELGQRAPSIDVVKALLRECLTRRLEEVRVLHPRE
jgi:lipoate-protein ligase B